MSIKLILDTLDGLSDEVKGMYAKQDDGKFRLDVEGGVKSTEEISGLTSALGSERENAKTLAKQLKAFEGLDAQAAREAIAKVASFTEDQNKQAEKFEADLQARLQPITQERDALKADTQKMTEQLHAMHINATLSGCKAFEQVADPIYRENLISKIRPMLTIEENQVVGLKADGSKFFNAEGKPSTGEALITDIINAMPDKDLYFKGSNANGSGANNNAGTGNGGAVNPWAKDTWNVTKQSEITLKDPTLAASYRKAAGL